MGGAGARCWADWARNMAQARTRMSLPQASEELLREHYADLHGCPFYGQLVKYMGSGPVVAMVSSQ